MLLLPPVTQATPLNPAQEKQSNNQQHSKVKININTATKHELLALKGVGLKKAEAIIEFRKSHGKFQTVADLSQVKGIGDKLIAKNKGRLTLSGKNVLPPPKKMKSKVNKKLKAAAKTAKPLH